MKYPEDFINRIICGDCMEIMKDIPDNTIDLIVTSPPYDNLRDYENCKWDFGIFKLIAHEIFRIIKKGGAVVWVVGDAVINGSETGTSFKQALYFMKIGFKLHDTMIYEKNSVVYPDVIRYYQIFEYMFILSKNKPMKINLIKDRKNNWYNEKGFGDSSYRQKNGNLKSGNNKIRKIEYGIRNNIWKYNTGFGYTTKDKFAYAHPAAFPEQLAKDHILSWSNPGDMVLDPMAGSGTVLKMAQQTGRNYIGIEISSEYVKICKKRVEQKPLEIKTGE